MNKQFPATLRYLLSGILVLAFASTQAQSSANGDSTMHHRYGMHRWGGFNRSKGQAETNHRRRATAQGPGCRSQKYGSCPIPISGPDSPRLSASTSGRWELALAPAIRMDLAWDRRRAFDGTSP